MFAQQPEVAGAGDGLARRLRFGVRGIVRRRLVARGVAAGNGRAGKRRVARVCCHRLHAGQQSVELTCVEASERQVEAAHLLELRHLGGEKRLVPPGVQGDAIVRQPVSGLLGLGQAGAGDGGNGLQAQGFGGLQPAVAGDDLAALIHQDRRHEAELEDTGRDLRHLLGGMRARIAGIRHQCGDRARLDGARRPWGLGHAHLLELMVVVKGAA